MRITTGITLLLAGCALVAAVAFGIRVSQAIEPLKAKMRFFAVGLFGFAFVFAGIGLILLDYQLPTVEADGTIEAVSVHSQSKGYRSDISVRVGQGGLLALHASGRNAYFRRGEHVRLHYQGFTGLILRAEFVAPDGRSEGVLGTDFLTGYGMLCPGGATVFFGWKRYRRDISTVGSLPEQDAPIITTLRIHG